MKLTEFLLDTLFPPRCLLCGTTNDEHLKAQAVCDACLNGISIHQTLFCVACRARLAGDVRICHAQTPLRLASVGRYSDERLKSLITQLKYQYRTTARNALAVLMNRYLAQLAFNFDDYLILPIPLHSKRQRERGFNQSELIASTLATQLHLPMLTDTLEKIKQTKPQAETKNIQERRANLAGCFRVTKPELVLRKNIILVDDVCTSGATLIEATNVLKQAGGRNIIGFVIAQTD